MRLQGEQGLRSRVMATGTHSDKAELSRRRFLASLAGSGVGVALFGL